MSIANLPVNTVIKSMKHVLIHSMIFSTKAKIHLSSSIIGDQPTSHAIVTTAIPIMRYSGRKTDLTSNDSAEAAVQHNE